MKKILLIITGGVAIYKSLEIIRIFRSKGYEVNCVMTKSATSLINPVLFATISGNFVRTETFEMRGDDKITHITATKESDIVLVAPATANIIGKMANGIADDLASTLLIASKKTIVVAPAMNERMWENPAVQRNLKQIEKDGVKIINPKQGKLACNENGKGRMEDPEKIVEYIEKILPIKKTKTK